MTDRSFVIMGLPESGKTSYLAALWHLIEAGEVESSLILDHLEGDAAYLNEIAKSWRNFEKVQRTTMQNEQEVVLHLKSVTSGAVAAFAFPDLSGESFDRQVEERRCRTSYVQRFDDNDGLLLFVTANRPQDDRTIVEQNSAVGGPEPSAAQSGAGLPTSTWTLKALPAQIRIVEILQFLTRRPFVRKRRRVALMISAWDVVAEPRPSPAAWLARELPLVDQYLKSNAADFDVQIYGVSAQGVDLLTGDIESVAHLPASRRIMIEGPATGSDLTAPIVWLIANG